MTLKLGAPKRICPAVSQGARCDVIRQEAKRWSQVRHGRLQRVGDVLGRDTSSGPVACLVGGWAAARSAYTEPPTSLGRGRGPHSARDR